MKTTIFKEKDGTFSWRKALTATASFIFAFSAIGILFGLKPLPDQYLIIISGVFGFYFFKKSFEKIGSKNDVKEMVKDLKKDTEDIKQSITVPTPPPLK